MCVVLVDLGVDVFCGGHELANQPIKSGPGIPSQVYLIFRP